MGRTINAQKTPPKKKAIQGVEWERRSPRGHKSSTREIEVNARKRGTGPQGRGGKTITREQQLSSSESSESESDEGDEGLDGLYGIKRMKMVSRDELMAVLHEKQRTIKKTSGSAFVEEQVTFKQEESMRWSGEEINFADSVNSFVREFLFPWYKFLREGWQNYEPDKKNSLSSMCLRKLSLPEGSDTADIWERVIMPSIQMKYINIKGNMNNDLKKIYRSMSDILFENRRVFN